MSRQVPLDRALTDDDRRYLRQLGAHGMALEARIDETYEPDKDALAAFEKEERAAASKLNGAGLTQTDQDNLLEENARLRAQLAELQGDASEAPVDYTGWKKAELEAEVDRVNAADATANLSKGTVDEMKAALTAYFTE
jgi:hypothetical protein